MNSSKGSHGTGSKERVGLKESALHMVTCCGTLGKWLILWWVIHSVKQERELNSLNLVLYQNGVGTWKRMELFKCIELACSCL